MYAFASSAMLTAGTEVSNENSRFKVKRLAIFF
jgi:hypothetical protein